MKEEIIRTDVLCVGGGIAGLMAAIRAKEMGAKVVVAEKGNAIHSGRGRAGNDHFWCYIPEAHGSDIEWFLKECLKGPKLKAVQSGSSMKVLRTFLEQSFDIVKLWDSWGIPMKYNGKWEFAGHSYIGEILTHLKYSGYNQKPILYKKAREKGTEIINRVMIFDLLRSGDKVIGAIGISTREDKIYIFEAKSTILGTGFTDRLYSPPLPGYQPSTAAMLTLTGDGRSMAYRAGAELAGLETIRRHIGPRYLARYGQATWIGVLRDPQGKPIGPFLSKPDRAYHDMTAETNSSLPEEYMKSGRGPVYMDCTGASDEDYEYLFHWMKNEGLDPVTDSMKEEGIDLKKHLIEFGTLHLTPEGKIYINEKAETSLDGLIAAGDESTGTIGPAAVYGWISGETAVNQAKSNTAPDIEKARAQIEEAKNLVNEIKSRETGPDWREANLALQRVMQDYAGLIRSETLLSAGMQYLKRLREKARATVIARNQWELTRCLETLNLFDLGELVITAANERKETRGLHKRSDFPMTNPVLDNKVLFVKKVNGKPATEWRISE